MNAISYEKQLPVLAEYDVLVCGGGVAGFTAAVQAARLGAKTAIVDRHSELGGILTTGENGAIALFYAFGKQVIKGIGWEYCERLRKKGFASYPDFEHTKVHHCLGINVSHVGAAAEMDLMCKEAGVHLYYLQPICDVIKDGDGRVSGVAILTASGMAIIRAQQIIDCTGDGMVAYLAGAQYKLGEDDGTLSLQPGTLSYHMKGIDPKKIDEADADLSFRKAVENGEVSLLDNRCGAGKGHFILQWGGCNVNHFIINGTDSENVTKAHIESRERLVKLEKWIQAQKNCENAKITGYAPEITVRETRRIVGDAYITVDDYLSGRVYDDAICYSFYPIDLHQLDNDGQLYNKFHEEGVVPTIPLGALLVKGFENLSVAGRCASGDRLANSAYRVKASCMAMGQAVGVTAALAVKNGCTLREVPFKDIRKTLLENDAILPPLNEACE